MRLAAISQALQDVDVSKVSKHGEAMSHLMYSRNAAQHSLLCLESWECLNEKDQACAHKTVYDACRLTALIYSNAVLFAVPHHSGWHTVLAGKLRATLESGEHMNPWPASMHATLLWCLMIGGIAAFQSPNREYFERSLCALWRKMGRPPWKIRGLNLAWLSLVSNGLPARRSSALVRLMTALAAVLDWDKREGSLVNLSTALRLGRSIFRVTLTFDETSKWMSPRRCGRSSESRPSFIPTFRMR